MESIIIGEGIVELRFDSRKGMVELRNAQGEVVKSFDTMEKKSASAGDMMQSALKYLGSAAVLNALKNFTMEIARQGEELQNLGRRYGTSVENISRLQYASKMLGVDFGSLAAGMKFIAKNAVEADQGNKDLRAAFDELGVSVKDANGNFKDGHTLLLETLTKLDGVTNSTKQTRLGMQLLGRSGDELKGLSAEIKNAYDESDRLRNTWSAAEAAKADAFGDSIDRLKMSLAALSREGLMPVLPVLERYFNDLTESITSNDRWRQYFDIITFGTTNVARSLMGTGTASKAAITDAAAAMAPLNALMGSFGTVATTTGNDWKQTAEEIEKAKDEADKAQKEFESSIASALSAKPAWNFADIQTGSTGMNLPDPTQHFADMAAQAGVAMTSVRLQQEQTLAIFDATVVGLADATETAIAQAARNNANMALSAMGSIAEGMGQVMQNNKALFIFQQTISIMQMTMDAVAGWAKTWAENGWVGFALGAAIFARIMAMVAQVRSMKAPEPAAMKIPGAAEGGLIKQPSIIAIAEKRPEVVIPLDKMGEMGGGNMKLEIVTKDAADFERWFAVRLVKRAKDENLPGWSFAHV